MQGQGAWEHGSMHVHLGSARPDKQQPHYRTVLHMFQAVQASSRPFKGFP